MKQLAVLIGMWIGFMACSSGPEPIRYGEDACDYCRMGIVQPQYGAELITAKGKVFKFDAVECMIRFAQEDEKAKEAKNFLVSDFFNPGELVAVEKARFLHSKKLPSPMGMFLTAFGDVQSAEDSQQKLGGRLLEWEELNEQFDNLN
jgi:copper chaperone NosL